MCVKMPLPSIVTVKLSTILFLEGSVDVYSTDVSPILNIESGLWVFVRICEPELSDAVGSVQETVAVGNPLSVFCVILAGIPVMIGFSLSAC